MENSVGSALEHEPFTYMWQNDTLKLVERAGQYLNAGDYERYIDYFEYEISKT